MHERIKQESLVMGACCGFDEVSFYLKNPFVTIKEGCMARGH
jgi:hypothetical protein